MAKLKATKRGDLGTHKARRLRKSGQVPAVIYGHGQETVSLSLDLHEFTVALRHGARWLELDLEGQPQNALIKKVQYDPYGSDILHVDLTRVSLDERVKVTVPVVLRGKSSEENAALQQLAASLEVECLVTAIPDDVRVSVAEMKIGDSIKAKDVPLPAGAKLLSDPEMLVCLLTFVAEVEEVVAEVVPGAGEPEVIGAKVEEGEEGAAEAAPAEKGKKEEKEKKE